MYKYVAYVLLILSCFNFNVALARPPSFLRRKVPKIDLIRGYCPGHENAPVKMINIRITKQNGVTYISGKFVVTQDNYTQLQLILKSKRCASKEVLDSCESMQDVTLDRVCTSVIQLNQLWVPFVNSIQPRMGCPAKKGVYVINNGTFDVGPLANVPGSDEWYWRAQVEVYQQGTKILVFCFDIEGQISTS